MTIKPALESDLGRIAQCHISAFPKSLSSALGKRYVTKMLGWYLSSDRTFLFYGEDQTNVVGYCGGMIKEGNVMMGSASGMVQYSFDEAIRAFLIRPWLLFHPELRAKYWFIGKNLWTRLKKFVGVNQKMPVNIYNDQFGYVALVVIGVQGALQGKGYGTLLLEEFEKKTVQSGYKKALLTVLTANEKAIRAYKRNGWSITSANPQSTTMEKQWD
jgi:ribosomal protein S18 acetylase RimI-like enzyme